MTDTIEFRSDMTVDLIDSMGNDDSVIRSAKVSTMTDTTVDDMSAAGKEKFIDFLVSNRHGSAFEHCVMTFRIEAPIFVFRELFRHRIASPNEMSARYTEMRPVFYVPIEDRPLMQTGKPGAYTFEKGTPFQYEETKAEHQFSYTVAWQSYRLMLEEGIAREVARSVLPVGIYSQAYFTINLRSLTNLLSLRTKSDHSSYPSYPQYEIEDVAEQMEDFVTALFPLTYEAWDKNGRVGL